MATFVTRKRKDGTEAVLAQITFTAGGKRTTESRTHDTMKGAKAWVKKRQGDITDDIEAGRNPVTMKIKAITLGDAIDKYVAESLKEIGKTKAQVLQTIRKEYSISDKRCDQITSADIISFAQDLHNRDGLTSASTVLNYLSHLSSVFTYAPALWGFALDPAEMQKAKKAAKHMGFAATSNERTRRPTMEELGKLMEHFERATARDSRCIPMHRIMAFAIFSTRRQAEITRITWADYEPAAKRVMVRKMKNPGDKGGLDTLVELPDPCCAIIDAMPHRKDCIFPFNSDTISTHFTNACKVLAIEDLHFHDLRHEGASRLAEMGRTVPLLASVTGHRSWKSLQRYTHVQQAGDRFAGWIWLDAVTA